MSRKISAILFPLLLAGLGWIASARAQEIVDLEKAKADPDFAVQGEYVGQGEDGKVGVQVIAMGHGKFDIVVYPGGLPGAGWKAGGKKTTLGGKAAKDVEELKQKFSLKRIERKSPTLGQKAPEGAVVLFDGKSADKWNGKMTKDGYLDSDATTKQKFGNYKLHLEFRLSYMPNARGQGRSNSGVYPHDCYEMQVLDSFGLKGENNECGGFYTIKAPDVNMCLPPMQWQTYDVDFTAPKYEDGKKVANARVTVRHNGVMIHDNVELPRGTPGRQPEGPSPRPLYLQGHGNHVYYNNIWIEEKK